MKFYHKLTFYLTFFLLNFFCRNGTAQCSGTPNTGTISSSASLICTFTSASVSFSSSGLSTGSGISWQWQVSSGGSFTNVPFGNGGTTMFYTTPYLPVGTYSYQVRTTCAVSALSNTSNIIVINIRQTPTVSVSGTLTPGNNAVINTTGGITPYTYSWSPSVSTGSVGTALSSGVYSVVVADNSGCSDTVLFGVSVPVQLWGTTHLGGSFNEGTLYSCNPPLNTFTKTLDFVGTTYGGYGGDLIQAGNGKLYGLNNGSGTFSLGVLYSYNLATNTFTKLLDFNGSGNGSNPIGLMQANNGKLYGVTNLGGTNNKGVLFEYDISTNTYSKKFDFGSTSGENPCGRLFQASNGKLYGMTAWGGQSGDGTLFEYDPALNTYSVRVNFSLASGKGFGPEGSLMQATNGKLYGGTTSGGQFNYGVLFEYDLALSTYSVKVTFNPTIGAGPVGPFVQLSNGKLYGVAEGGGLYDYGVLFEYDPATGVYIKKIDFNAIPTGNGPFRLIKGSNGNLYGITVLGGVTSQVLMNNQGTLFEYHVAANVLFKKIDFDGPPKGGMPVALLELMPPCAVTVISSSGNSAVCAGSNVTLTASGTVNYAWSTGATSNSIVVSPATSTNYAVAGSAPSCVTPTTPAVAMVSVNPLPNVVANKIIICNGNTGTLTASGASTYSWSTGATASSITASPASTTNYTVTGYSAQGCARSETVSITVFTTPTIAVNSATICAGETATLSAWGLDTYTWNTSATTSVINVSPLSTAVYTINGHICSVPATNTAQVWVNSLPTVAITSATVCSNQVATLIPTGASSYSLNGIPVTTFTFNPPISTAYSVTGSSNNCISSNTAVATVSVNAAPVVSVTNATICSGQTASLVAGGAVSYSVNGAAANTFTFNPVNTTTYAVTGANNYCISNSVVTTVSVNATPVVSITSSTICSGQTATLVPAGANSYSVNGVPKTTFTFNPANTSTYAITGLSNNCVSNPAIATVSVNARPVVSVTSATACSGQIVTLTPSGATSYSVNTVANNTFTFNVYNTSYAITGTSNNCVSSNTAIAIVSAIAAPWVSIADATICAGETATLIPYGASSYSVNGAANNTFTFNPINTSTYAVTGFSNPCMSMNTVIVTVSVNPAPTVSINNSVICSGQSATLVPTGANTYTVSSGLFIVTPNTTTNYSVTGTDGSGCVSGNTAIATVSVNILPTVSVNGAVICSGQSATLIPTGASTYSINGGLFIVSPNVTSNYAVTGTDGNGCVSANPAIATVSVIATPTIIAGSSTICAGNIYSMTVTGANGYSVNGNAVNSLTFSPANTSSYTVTVANNGCVSNSIIAMVSVNTLPTVSVNNATICSGNSATIIPGGASTYTISGGSFTVTPNTTTNYFVTGTDTNGCTSNNTAVANVLVNASPTLSISDATICVSETIVLTVSGANTYTWSTGAKSETLTLAPGTTTSYSVTGTNNNGCENSSLATVFVDACTGITALKNERKGPRVFPNPNHGTFTIECEPDIEVTITDIIGRIVHRQNSIADQTQISLTGLANGVYFVKAAGFTKKIIKESGN
jgi:uncharacterized repeat protein (TIGR03803 family)